MPTRTFLYFLTGFMSGITFALLMLARQKRTTRLWLVAWAALAIWTVLAVVVLLGAR